MLTTCNAQARLAIKANPGIPPTVQFMVWLS